MKRRKRIASLFDGAMAGLVYFSFGLILFAVLIVCAEVVSRYIINKPITWVEQVSGYILVYVVFFNAAWVLKKERHIKLDILQERLSPRARDRLNVVTSLLGAVICLVLTWFGAVVTWDYFQRGTPSVEMLRVPLYLVWWVIPLGGLLLFIQFLRRTLGFLAALRATAGAGQTQEYE